MDPDDDLSDLYDDVPPWALAVAAADPSSDAHCERLAAALTAVLGAAYPGQGLDARPGAQQVVTVWSGGPDVVEVLDVVGLSWATQDRGAWIALVDFVDPTVWPEEWWLGFVFRRRDV